MGYIVRMPKLGLEMESGVLLEWYVEVGESFEEGDVLAEVESEKSIGEVEAREEGVLREVYLEEGGEVPPSTPIGIVAAPDADISDLQAEAESDLAESAPDAADIDTEEAAAAEATTAAGETESGEPASGTGDGADVKASPRAERRAEELGVDLTAVEGTGFDGAITEEDIEAAAEAEGQTVDESAEEVKASPRAEQRAEELGVDLTTVEGTGFDGAITEEDVEAAAEAETGAAVESETGAAVESETGAAVESETEAAVESETEAAVEAGTGGPVEAETEPDATGARRITPGEAAADRYGHATVVADPSTGEALFGTVEAVRTAFEERVTMTDLLVVVAAAALADHPVVNGTYTESTHQVAETADLALVADADGEPVTRVVPDAGNRSLAEVIEARQGDDEGGSRATFTLVNATETDGDGRLVNPPTVATLEVDPTGQRAIPDGDGVDLRPLVTARLTYDARALGDADAVTFLESFLDRAEASSELVLNSYRGAE